MARRRPGAQPLATPPVVVEEGRAASTATAPSTAAAPPEPAPAPVRCRRTERRRWATSFLLLHALGTGWALASPLFSTPDEGSHVVMAAAAARGQLAGREVPGAPAIITSVRVPGVFSAAHGLPSCYAFNMRVSADCAPPFEGPKAEQDVETTAGRYPPLYYMVAGLPSLLFPSAAGVYLMRIVGAALCAAFLASAFLSASSWRRSRFVVLALAVAVTPMVLFLAGAVNPNGMEISAAASLWVSGLALVNGVDEQLTRPLVRRVGVAGAALALVRGLSPLWLGAIVLALAAVAGRHRLREILRRRDMRRWVVVVACCCVVAVVWIAVHETLDVAPVPGFEGTSSTEALRVSIGKTDGNVHQMVGVFGHLDTPSPALTYYAWFLALGLVVMLGLALSTRRLVLAILSVLAAILVVPVLSEAQTVEKFGYAWQGRYTLPLAIGIPILAGAAVAARPEALAGTGRRMGLVFAIALGLGHVAAFAGALRRHAVGTSGPLNFLDGRWDPPLPTPFLLAGFTVAVVGYGVWLVGLSSVPTTPVGVASDE